MTKTETKTKVNNKNEIIWNIINSALAGALIFLGSFTSGKITFETAMAALAASLIVFCTKFKDYWNEEKPEYTKAFSFIK